MQQAVATTRHEQDFSFAQAVLNGSDTAAADLRSRYQSRLVAILCARGASRTEAEDLVADLWADCFGAAGHGQGLLAKFQGRSSLQSWLITVAMHRLIDLKRRQTFRKQVAAADSDPDEFFHSIPQSEESRSEQPLLDLMLRATQKAFAANDSEGLLMLKLFHLHRVTQREIARMWGWHESKVSRAVDSTRQQIAKEILVEVKRSDPWLELRWEDFIELCERTPDLFAATV